MKTHGWTLKHTFHHEKPAAAFSDGKAVATNVEKGFNVRPIYVFEKK
jgi:hypothetical protein